MNRHQRGLIWADLHREDKADPRSAAGCEGRPPAAGRAGRDRRGRRLERDQGTEDGDRL